MPGAALVWYDLVDVCYGITVVAVRTSREKQPEIELKIEPGKPFSVSAIRQARQATGKLLTVKLFNRKAFEREFPTWQDADENHER